MPDEAALLMDAESALMLTFVALLLRRWPGDGRVLIAGVDAAIRVVHGRLCWWINRE